MENFKILTYNLRCPYNHPIDGVNSFIHRAGLMLDKIDAEKPHVICFQEVSDEIRSFLKRTLAGYGLIGHGRLENYDGEGLCIAYRDDCMELFGLDQFWLSPTPYVPATRYEIQSQYPRICPAAILKHKDMKTPIRVYNVHLDHECDEARILGMQQILNKVKEDNEKVKYPTFILGDFNSVPDSKTISFCNEYKDYPIVDLTEGLGETYHDFGGTGNTVYARGWKIDYIFTDPETADRKIGIKKWMDNSNGIYLSDHYPVCLEIGFEGK